MPQEDRVIPSRKVATIRKQLGWPRDKLAAFLWVSKDAVRKWEDGVNSCTGPAARLLKMLHDDPGLLWMYGNASDQPPEPRLYPKRTLPWLKLQRVLGLLRWASRKSSDTFNEILEDEQLDQDWLDQALSEGFLRYDLHQRLRVSAFAEEAFELISWKRWADENYAGCHTQMIPLKTEQF